MPLWIEFQNWVRAACGPFCRQGHTPVALTHTMHGHTHYYDINALLWTQQVPLSLMVLPPVHSPAWRPSQGMPSGRLLSYTPTTGITKVLAKGGTHCVTGRRAVMPLGPP